MSEQTENTLSAYLGPEFQQRLMWQLLVEPEFAEKIIPDLAVEYFDDPNFKRLFIIILEYFKEFDKVPNLQNQSIHQAINKYKTPNNVIEEESLFAVIKRVQLWNERIINKQMLYDGDVIQKSATTFIKQQEYRKLAEGILDKVKSGDIKSKYAIAAIEDKFQKISHIGDTDDDGESILEGIDKALRKEFRETIPTGIGVIDSLTGGGLGKSEIGIILTPSGVGKTTALTIIANTAYECEKNVAQIIFEDTVEQVKRKHYTIWAKSELSKLNEDDENERVTRITHEKAKSMEGKGRLIIKRFSQEDTTIKDVRNWMTSQEKKYGFKFDILVLDYLDCLESHKKTPDRTEAELTIIKGFESLSADFDIPAWTAIQSNRSGFGSEFVEAHQSGGSIKRVQKAHFFMSVAKTAAQQEANLANIRIIKARFAKDGQTFEDCVFDNNKMKIIIHDERYPNPKLKHHDVEDVERLERKAKDISDGRINAAVSEHLNGDTIGDLKKLDINTMLQDNQEREEIKQVVNIVNDAVNNTSETGVTEEILILDGEITEVPPENEGASDGASEGASEGANLAIGQVPIEQPTVVNPPDLLDWSGETTTTSFTVAEMMEVPVHVPYIPHMVTEPMIEPEESLPVIEKIVINVETKEQLDNQSLDDLEKLFDDPDELQGENKDVHLMLKQKHNYQHVIKKE